MVNNKAIGLFDSGVGGLSVLNSLQNTFPSEKFIYVGDNQNAPWGNKSKDTLLQLTDTILEFLNKKDIKCLVIACNTTYSYLKDYLSKKCPVPIINLLEESCHDAISTSLNQRICVMATQGTISTHCHLDYIKHHHPSSDVLELGCHDLVQYIEDNSIDIPECQDKLREYTLELTRFKADTLIYACSHFPFLDSSIRRYCSPELRTINPAISVRHTVKNCLDTIGYGTHDLSKVECYVTGSKEKFNTFVSNYCSLNNYKILEETITPKVSHTYETDFKVLDSVKIID